MPVFFAIPSDNATGKTVELWRKNAAGADTLTARGFASVAAGQAAGQEVQEQRWWIMNRTPDLWPPNVEHYLKVSTDPNWQQTTAAAFANDVTAANFSGGRTGAHLWVRARARYTDTITGTLPAGTHYPPDGSNLDVWGASQVDIGISQIRLQVLVGVPPFLRGHIHTKRVDNTASTEYWFLNQDYDFNLANSKQNRFTLVDTGEHFSELRRAGWPSGSYMVGVACRYTWTVIA